MGGDKDRVRADWYCKDCTIKGGLHKGKRLCNSGLHLHCKQCQMHKRSVFGGNKESGPPSMHSTATTPADTRKFIKKLEADITDLRKQLRERPSPKQSDNMQVEGPAEVEEGDLAEDKLGKTIAELDAKIQKLPESLVQEVPELATTRAEMVAQRDKLRLEYRERKPVGAQITEVNRKLFQLDQKIQKAEAGVAKRKEELKLLETAIADDETNLATLRQQQVTLEGQRAQLAATALRPPAQATEGAQVTVQRALFRMDTLESVLKKHGVDGELLDKIVKEDELAKLVQPEGDGQASVPAQQPAGVPPAAAVAPCSELPSLREAGEDVLRNIFVDTGVFDSEAAARLDVDKLRTAANIMHKRVSRYSPYE